MAAFRAFKNKLVGFAHTTLWAQLHLLSGLFHACRDLLVHILSLGGSLCLVGQSAPPVVVSKDSCPPPQTVGLAACRKSCDLDTRTTGAIGYVKSATSGSHYNYPFGKARAFPWLFRCLLHGSAEGLPILATCLAVTWGQNRPHPSQTTSLRTAVEDHLPS